LTVPPDSLDIERVTVNGKQIPLLKCPFCNFRNIHEDTILHHIRWNDNSAHWVDVEKVDTNSFFIHNNKNRKKQSRYHYERKEDLSLPWIKCLWCDYQDKIVRDLERHFLENHRRELYQLGWTYHTTEAILEKASKLARAPKRSIFG